VLLGRWEIGVTMDEVPFAVDAAIDVRTRIVIEVGALAIENASQRCQAGSHYAAPAPSCMLERENMGQ
jgi:hypothetical protein